MLFRNENENLTFDLEGSRGNDGGKEKMPVAKKHIELNTCRLMTNVVDMEVIHGEITIKNSCKCRFKS